MRTAVLLVLALTLSAVATPMPEVVPWGPEKPDAEAILGLWRTHTREEQNASLGWQPYLKFKFKPNGSYEWGYKGMMSGTYTIDPSVWPKTIDLDESRAYRTTHIEKAIYVLGGDVLKLFIPERTDGARPKALKATEGVRYIRLKRLG